MHPAVSVIFFTVTSGAGLGLIFLLGLGWPMHSGMWAIFFSCLLAGGLTAAGLVSSTFHLGHPERAWRAFSQWQSSWLSREGVLAVLTLTLFGIYTLLWAFMDMRLAWLGFIISILAALTVYATAMIYAQLKTVPNWYSALTPLCYLTFSLASGLILASAIGTSNSVLGLPSPILAAIALVIAWISKFIWWNRAASIGFSATGSDTGTATGLGHLGKVKLFEKPHSGENYLTKEMVHQIGRKHANKLRVISLVLGLAVPLVLCFLALSTGATAILLTLGFLSMMAGLFAERWLFFAEAKHAVSLYY
ncbi:MAG: DmsC/YnfH family molybdoenzyme membrane anchor subunit [Salaquimonas sp.]